MDCFRLYQIIYQIWSITLDGNVNKSCHAKRTTTCLLSNASCVRRRWTFRKIGFIVRSLYICCKQKKTGSSETWSSHSVKRTFFCFNRPALPIQSTWKKSIAHTWKYLSQQAGLHSSHWCAVARKWRFKVESQLEINEFHSHYNIKTEGETVQSSRHRSRGVRYHNILWK